MGAQPMRNGERLRLLAEELNWLSDRFYQLSNRLSTEMRDQLDRKMEDSTLAVSNANVSFLKDMEEIERGLNIGA